MKKKFVRLNGNPISIFCCVFVFLITFTPSVCAQIEVDVNFDINHVIGGIDSFDREKYIVIHADATESDYNTSSGLNLIGELLNTYDAYYGRETGRMRFIGEQVSEQDSSPGSADPDDISMYSGLVNDVYAATTARHANEFKGRTIVAAQDRPFFPDGTTNSKGFAFSEQNDPNIDDDFGTATGKFMAQMLEEAYGNGGADGPPTPSWVEVINEPFFPLIDFASVGQEASVDEIFELHKSVAREVKALNPSIMVGGFTNAFPDLEFRTPISNRLFSQWDERWRRFIDEVGADMDFYSIHLYDFHSIGGGNSNNSGTPGGGVTSSSRELLRKGGNIEATLDMIEHYNTIRHGEVKPWLISEYGAQLNDFYSEPWSAQRDWLILKSFSSMMLQFMERPDVIQKTVPFVLGRADFLFGSVTPERVYPWRMLRGLNEPSQLDRDNLESAVFTEVVKFYQLWSEVKGKRVDSISSDLDLMVDAYVDISENKAYVILNSLDKEDLTVNLNEFGIDSASITSINIKHLFQAADGSPTLDNSDSAVVPDSLIIKPEATMIIEYSFDAVLSVDQTSTEKKVYATTYKQTIRANQAISFTVPGVSLASNGEAVLRVGIGRNSFLSRRPAVSVNGNAVNVPVDYRGDVQLGRDVFPLGRDIFFGVLEIPVPYQSLVVGDNLVTLTFPDGVDDNSGAVSSLALQLFDFSRAVSRTSSLEPNPVDRSRSLSFDNRDSFIPNGGTVPRFELGADENFTISYATGVSGGVEEDLFYVATQIRQLDENANTVATSAFSLAVPDAADNLGTTTFAYTIPTNFATGADGVSEFTDAIPQSADLPNGHTLLLILFMSTDNNTFFVDANTEVMIGDGAPAVENRTRSIKFDNIARFTPENATLPELGIGQTLDIEITYATGIANFVEEDLFYVATFVRQVDEGGNNVADSAFTVVVPDAADNATNTTFSYQIPTNFSVDGNGSAFTDAIPKTVDLPQGHQLKLILFMSTDDNSFFADANTDITIGTPTDIGPPTDSRARSLSFDNIADFVPLGGSLPRVSIGDVLNMRISYATGISGGVEEDLNYIAVQVRQLDEVGGVVGTSAFTVAVNGDEANTGMIDFSYPIPTNFALGPDNTLPFTGPIPMSENLPDGHQLRLLIFLSSDNDAFFVNADTQIILDQVQVVPQQSDICFPVKAKNNAIAIICI